MRRGYCVRRPDGTPYRIPEYWFHHSLLPDFTNPEAVSWWFGKRKHLLDMGVEGFKTDGGEFLYEKAARLHDGSTGLTARNLYSMQYAGAYHQFMKDGGVDGVTFSRAGYAGAQALPIHWAGDQLSLWSEFRAQLAAGISAGLSGVLFWGFDIGGFAGELPAKDLYLRATAMGCFSPVMQWHAEPRSGQFFATHEGAFNNDRSPWNLARQSGDPSILDLARFYAALRDKLLPYLTQEARLCVESARPMMAHLCLDFPEDPEAWVTEGPVHAGAGAAGGAGHRGACGGAEGVFAGRALGGFLHRGGLPGRSDNRLPVQPHATAGVRADQRGRPGCAGRRAPVRPDEGGGLAMYIPKGAGAGPRRSGCCCRR